MPSDSMDEECASGVEVHPLHTHNIRCRGYYTHYIIPLSYFQRIGQHLVSDVCRVRERSALPELAHRVTALCRPHLKLIVVRPGGQVPVVGAPLRIVYMILCT